MTAADGGCKGGVGTVGRHAAAHLASHRVALVRALSGLVLTREVWTNQTPLCYIIGHNKLRYQALPWHISYQETV